MEVIKRDGSRESVDFNKIHKRIDELVREARFEYHIDSAEIAKKVIDNLVSGITTEKLDHIAAETCAYLSTVHPDYAYLAGRIEVSNLHKKTEYLCKNGRGFYKTMELINQKEELIDPVFLAFVEKHADDIEKLIDYKKDYRYDYFGFKTLEKSYLLRANRETVERPQHLLMRTAIGIWYKQENMDNIIKTYYALSDKLFTHATPTLFNAGLNKPQLASCFLLDVQDSITGIYKTLSDCAKISKSAGGIGIAIHKVRARGARIKGTNGISNGIIPMARVFNETARYVDQGGGKRKGSFALYLEPWHGDIMDFLSLKLNHGKEELRTRDLFLGLWVPDLFMKRVENNEMWTLMDPSECPGLSDVWGDEFEKLYTRYEQEGKGMEELPARKVWDKIISSQVETGVPYMVYKDHSNAKSNQKNLGTIQSSNLCAEIIEFTNSEETAVCNLGSIALNAFASNIPMGSEGSLKDYDFQALHQSVQQIVINLNQVIDTTFYPTQETQTSNLRHRPIGLGVQGLADVFFKMRTPFGSPLSKELNSCIFETMYHAALTASLALAKKEGAYESFQGSPLSQGEFQYNLWGVSDADLSGMWDFASLREEIKQHGVRNSLLLALMPTASTAQILGNNECFEPITSNIMARRVLSGDFININEYMVRDLIRLGLWDNELKDSIIKNRGSVQHLDISEELKELYKTVWEISQKVIIDMSADRGKFICQSQSMNVFVEEPNLAKLTSLHFYAWKKGLKTGSYYLRQRPKAAVQFTVPV